MKLLNLTELEWAYLAGFLDGDGALIAQLVKGEYKYLYRIRVSIVFFQSKSRH